MMPHGQVRLQQDTEIVHRGQELYQGSTEDTQLSGVKMDIPSMAAVLNLFRLADHLTNFVSLRGPPQQFLHFLGKISEFLTTFLVIFSKFFLVSRSTKKNFANFPNFLAFFWVKDRHKIPISICNLVVTQSIKRYQVLVHSFVRNQPERRWGQVLLIFLFSHRNDTSL